MTVITVITVAYGTAKDPLGLARTAWYVLENGRKTGYYGYATKEEAEKQGRAIAQIRSGRFEAK
jgi:hypothetical protein